MRGSSESAAWLMKLNQSMLRTRAAAEPIAERALTEAAPRKS